MPSRHERFPLRAASIAAVALAAIGAGCGPAPRPGGADRCAGLPAGAGDPTEPWVFVLCEEVDPGHVAAPRNDAEDVVFRHAYGGLVDLDCSGEVVAGLAREWSTPDDGRTWTNMGLPDSVLMFMNYPTRYDNRDTERARLVAGEIGPATAARGRSTCGTTRPSTTGVRSAPPT